MINYLIIRFAAVCPGGDFFGLPKWYKYLDGITQYIAPDGHIIDPTNSNDAKFLSDPGTVSTCVPRVNGLGDVWLVVAAIIELLLRIAVLASISMVVWGGIQYIMSQGEPDKTAKARSTIVSALIGLVISVGAATVVTFFAGRFTK